VAEKLTLRSIDARAVSVPLRRPVVSKVGVFREWPLILIDLYTQEGIVGRSYLEPYLKNAARYVIPALHDLAEAQQGQPLAPLERFQANRRSLNLVGYEGIAMIAVAGLDMAMWDALAKAAGQPLAVLFGGTIGPVPAYNSNGLWLTDLAKLAAEARELVSEGAFTGLKLRLGRDRLDDDLTAIREVREAAGSDVKLISIRACRSAMRSAGVMLSTIRLCTGSKSRSPTTTCRATHNLPSNSIRRCKSARIFTVRAICTKRSALTRATT
jgi:mandelate racemase